MGGNLGQLFTFSYNQLKKNKELVLPFFFYYLTFFICLILFILLSGASGLISEYNNMDDEYSKYYQKELENGNTYPQSKIDYYFENSQQFKESFSGDNLIKLALIGIFTVIFGWLLGVYFQSIGYFQNSQTVSEINYKPDFFHSMKNSKYLPLIKVKLLWLIIFFIPLILIGVAILLSFTVNNLLGVLSIFIGIILYIACIIYIGVRLFFVIPKLYFEEESNKEHKIRKISTIDLFKRTIELSKNKFAALFVLALIFYALVILVDTLYDISFHFSIFMFTLGAPMFLFILFFLLILIFVSALTCYLNLFLMNSYQDFKNKISISKTYK